MKCQFCNNPATVHLTKVVNKRKRELQLCEACARKRKLLPGSGAAGTLTVDVKALLGLLVGPLQPGSHDPNALACPDCGLQYAEFRAEGRLGCPRDYETFRTLLEPLLERIHRSLTHAGKVPSGFREMQRGAELSLLRQQMADAVAGEHYERAAQLRDLIRQKEAPDESR